MLLLYLYLKTWLYSWCLAADCSSLQQHQTHAPKKLLILRFQFGLYCLWLKTSGIHFTQHTCVLAWAVYLATPKDKQEKLNVKVWQLSILLATPTSVKNCIRICLLTSSESSLTRMRDILCEMSLQEYPARGEKKKKDNKTQRLTFWKTKDSSSTLSIYMSNDNLCSEQLLLSGRVLETLVYRTHSNTTDLVETWAAFSPHFQTHHLRCFN